LPENFLEFASECKVITLAKTEIYTQKHSKICADNKLTLKVVIGKQEQKSFPLSNTRSTNTRADFVSYIKLNI
jgi:hypothetical protein